MENWTCLFERRRQGCMHVCIDMALVKRTHRRATMSLWLGLSDSLCCPDSDNYDASNDDAVSGHVLTRQVKRY